MLIRNLIEMLELLENLHGNVEVVSSSASSGSFFGASRLAIPVELREPKVCKIITNEKFDPHSNKEPEELVATINLHKYIGRKAIYIIGG